MKNLDTNLNTSQSIELHRYRNLKFVFRSMITWITRISFTKLLGDIKLYFKVIIRYIYLIRELIYNWWCYCVLMCLRVLEQSASRSSMCFEVKNFASNNKNQLLGVSYILRFVARKKSLQDQVQLGIGAKVQL